jgi:hypothetical protein
MAPTTNPGSRSRSRAEINITNNAELLANTQNILSVIRESRPQNTLDVYEPKQQEFKVGKPVGSEACRLIQLAPAILRVEAI